MLAGLRMQAGRRMLAVWDAGGARRQVDPCLGPSGEGVLSPRAPGSGSRLQMVTPAIKRQALPLVTGNEAARFPGATLGAPRSPAVSGNEGSASASFLENANVPP